MTTKSRLPRIVPPCWHAPRTHAQKTPLTSPQCFCGLPGGPGGNAPRVEATSGGRAARDQPASVEPRAAQLIDALEAQLTEQGERTARLEAQLSEVEQRLADLSAAVPAIVPAAAHEDHRRREVREIGWRWSQAAEWSYWLRRCEGFVVRDGSGAVGVVESVRFGGDLELPETLVVGAGGRGRRRHVEIAVSELAEVDPEQREVVLAGSADALVLPGASRWLPRWLPLRRHFVWPRSARS
jgi:uncharacterized coiled-coil protein SlyX